MALFHSTAVWQGLFIPSALAVELIEGILQGWGASKGFVSGTEEVVETHVVSPGEGSWKTKREVR